MKLLYNEKSNMNRYFRNPKIIISISVIVVIVLITSYAMWHKMISSENGAIISTSTPQNEVISDKPETFGRATFFHSQPVMGSISIPSSWEGKYRLKEEGDQVKFQFIGNPDIVSDIFVIGFSSVGDNDSNNEKRLILDEEAGRIFYYIKSESNPYTGSEADEFSLMQKKAEDLIKTFRTIILN